MPAMGQMTSLVFSGAMNLVVVGLLIGLWAWVLLPGLLRERRNSSPLETVSRFERSMDTLAQTGMEQAVGRHVVRALAARRGVAPSAGGPPKASGGRAFCWRGKGTASSSE